MKGASIVIAGPADGFKAYRFPDSILENDDSYALSGSEVSLREGGVAYKIARVHRARTINCVRFAAYKQVYEPNLHRAGHSFGVILEFAETIPSLDSVFEIIAGLLVIVEEHCVVDGRFCEARNFENFLTTFLQSTLGAGLANVFARFKNFGDRPISRLPSDKYLSPSYFLFIESKDVDVPLLNIWRWFLYSFGGGMLISLIAASQGVAANGISSPILPDLNLLDKEAASVVLDQLERLDLQIDEMHSKLERSGAEISALLSDRSAVQSALKESEEKRRQLEDAMSGLQKKVSSGTTKRPAVLTEGDLTSIRQIVADAVQANSKRASPPVSAVTEGAGGGDAFIYWVIGGVSLFIVAFLGLYAFMGRAA